MWNQERVNQFCSQYGFVPIMTKSELKELPNILSNDEELHGILQGGLSAIKGNNYNGLGLIIATNKRVIFLRKSIIGTLTKEEYSLPLITSVAYRKGLMVSSVVITAANNEAIIERCEKGSADKFINVVTNLIQSSQSYQNQKNNLQNSDDSIQKLERLFDLKQKGVITEDEYSQQKAKLLGEM